jgi:D-aspartate ligase
VSNDSSRPTAAVENQPDVSRPGARWRQGRASERGTIGAVVTGGDYRALGVVRSLGRKGIPVCVLTRDGHVLASKSRYSTRSLHWPAGDEESQVHFLAQLCEEYNLHGWLLIPSDDDAAALIANHYENLAAYFRLTTPPFDEFHLAGSKKLMYRLAESLDIPQPWTCFPVSQAELALTGNSFPAILKPLTRVGMTRLTNTKAWRVESAEELLEEYRKLSALAGPDSFMIQELIPGGGESQYSFAALCLNGQTLASVTARRLRQIPMDFGRFSTYVETVDEPAVALLAGQLLQAMNFTGLVEVEFKRDARDGAFKLLDVNPRVWGWHSLCQRAGVDFPYLLWLQAFGKPLPSVRAKSGVRWMRLNADVLVAASEIAHGRMSLIEYLRSFRAPRESAIFSADDPLPGLLELPLTLGMMLRRKLRHTNRMAY